MQRLAGRRNTQVGGKYISKDTKIVIPGNGQQVNVHEQTIMELRMLYYERLANLRPLRTLSLQIIQIVIGAVGLILVFLVLLQMISLHKVHDKYNTTWLPVMENISKGVRENGKEEHKHLVEELEKYKAYHDYHSAECHAPPGSNQ